MTSKGKRARLSILNKHAAKLAMDIRPGLPDVLLSLSLSVQPRVYGHEAMEHALKSITAEDLLNMLREAAEKRRGLRPGSLQSSPQSLAPTHTTKGPGV